MKLQLIVLSHFAKDKRMYTVRRRGEIDVKLQDDINEIAAYQAPVLLEQET